MHRFIVAPMNYARVRRADFPVRRAEQNLRDQSHGLPPHQLQLRHHLHEDRDHGGVSPPCRRGVATSRQGRAILLSHRGKPAARLEPLIADLSNGNAGDPYLSIENRAKPSPKGRTRHQDIDHILYGRR